MRSSILRRIYQGHRFASWQGGKMIAESDLAAKGGPAAGGSGS